MKCLTSYGTRVLASEVCMEQLSTNAARWRKEVEYEHGLSGTRTSLAFVCYIHTLSRSPARFKRL